MPSTQKPEAAERNRLLAVLPSAVRKRIASDCEEVSLGVKQTIYEPNKPIPNAYFPVDAVLSMIATMDDGDTVEVATTGNEGMVGIPLFLGVDRTPLKSFSQVPGAALRIPTELFRKHVRQEPQLARVLSRFAEALMIQISQGTACNRAHSVEQRCCRWLLMTHDRVQRDRFPLTQEFLAQMVGVRRGTVNEVASKLQEERLIRYSRGVIAVVNRRGLEQGACICYWTIRREYDRLLGNGNRK